MLGVRYLSSTAILLAAPFSVLAQTQVEETAASPSEAEIVVTGSRIPRNDLESNSPITLIGADRLQNSADTNIVRELQQLPAFSPTRSPSSGDESGFTGSFADLRGLGRGRTLVLVDGKRWITALSDGGVDLSTIPPELIDRVEVVTGGASATYGSDAVAGVVNILLRRDFDGVEINAQAGLTDRGEATNKRLALTGGHNFAENRGSFYYHLSYDRTHAIAANGRSFLDPAVRNEGGQFVRADSDTIPRGSALIGDDRAMFDGSGNLFLPSGQPNLIGDGDLFNEGRFARVQLPSRKFTFAAGLDYKPTDNVRIYTQGTFIRDETWAVRSPDPRDLSASEISLTNPFLALATRDYLAGLDLDGDGRVTVPGLSRRFVEAGPRTEVNDRDTFRVLGGVEVGLGADWKLDVSGMYGESNFALRFTNVLHNERLAQALDAVPGPNGPVCRVPAAGSLPCAPLNVFGPGNLSSAALDFIRTEGALEGNNIEVDALAVVTGTLFDLPAGPVGVSGGIEYRKSKASEKPNDIARLGLSSNLLAELSAALEQKEVFAEANIPVLRDAAFAHFLGLEVGVRYTTFNPGTDAWTYKILGEWAPIEQLRIRGGFQRATRAPNPFELGGGDQDTVPIGVVTNDPCLNGAPLTGDLRAACVATGVPVAVADVGGVDSPDREFRVTFFGNPDLTPEIAKTWTLGAVLRDPGVHGLSLTADYYNIQLQNVVTSVGFGTTINRCYASGTAGTDPLCAKIERDPGTGLIRSMDDGPINAGAIKTSGLDFGLSYNFKLGESNKSIALNIIATRLFEFETQPLREDSGSAYDCAGWYGPQCRAPRPKWKSSTNLAYRGAAFSASLTWTWIGPVKDDAAQFDTATLPTLARTKIGSRNYYDVNVLWNASKSLELRAGIENLLDTKPIVVGTDRGPQAADTNTFQGLYDAVGRRFFAGARVRF